MTTRSHIWWLSFLITTLFIAVTSAVGVQVTASINPQQIYAGATARLEIEITDSDPASPPSPAPAPVVDGLSIQFAGISRIAAPNVTINGRRQNTGPDRIVLQYAVTPSAPGRYVIPAMPVVLGTQTITTSPLVLHAVEPPESDDIAITASLDHSEVYSGEPVTVLVTVYYLNVRSASFSTKVPDGFSMYPSISPAESTAATVYDLEINGRRIRAPAGLGTLKGRQWKTLTIAYTLIPTHAGTFEIPGPTATLEVITGQRGFGLFAENVTERRIARAEPMSLTVKPLPIAGRPRDFSGLVGKFDIRTSAQATDVHVGEPIPLTMSITGPRPLERLDPPDLSAIPAFADNFKLSPEGWTEAPGSGSVGPARVREFTTTIRAISDAVQEIPPVSFSYFDPDRVEYRTAASRAIPLNIRETRQVTAADAIGGATNGNGGFALPRVERTPLTPGEAGPAFAPIPRRLTSQHLLLTDQIRSPLIAAAVALPPVALAASAILVIRRRSHDPDRSRRRRDLHRALARLGASPTADQAADAIRASLADRFGLDAPTITAHDARRLLGPIDPELAEDSARALLAADAGHFASSPGAQASLGVDPRSVLTRLAKVAVS